MGPLAIHTAQRIPGLIPCSMVVFWVYGHSNIYIKYLQQLFPNLQINIFNSDNFVLSEFLASIDVVVSVAQNEGFGRPIASALESGVPCYLIDSIVFREFFEGGANFALDVPSLVRDVFQAWELNKINPICFNPKSELLDAFESAIERIEDF